MVGWDGVGEKGWRWMGGGGVGIGAGVGWGRGLFVFSFCVYNGGRSLFHRCVKLLWVVLLMLF